MIYPKMPGQYVQEMNVRRMYLLSLKDGNVVETVFNLFFNELTKFWEVQDVVMSRSKNNLKYVHPIFHCEWTISEGLQNIYERSCQIFYVVSI